MGYIQRKKHIVTCLTILFFLSTIQIISADDITDPSLNFVFPTPENYHYQTERYVNINVSIDEENLSQLDYNWDETNYTLYNDTLVLMYNFDNIASLGEDSSTVVDMSSKQNSGSVVSATWDESGKYHGGFNFDGENDYITADDVCNHLDSPSEMTLSCWIKPRTHSQTGYFLSFNDNDNSNNIQLGYQSDGIFKFYDGSVTTPVTSLQVNTWYHLAVTIDSSNTVVVYVNGTNSKTTTTTVRPESNAKFSMGQEWDGGGASNFFNGIMDEIRIWNSALTQNEIYQQYASNLQKYNQTKWFLTVNQSKNATEELDDGIYTYQAFATDTNTNQASTEQRTLGINIEPTPPVPEATTLTLTTLGSILLVGVIGYSRGKKKR